MAGKTFLAVDLGASGGRVVGGRFDGRQLALDDIHRFENGGIPAADRLYWDFLGLWNRVGDGLRAAAARYGDHVASVTAFSCG